MTSINVGLEAFFGDLHSIKNTRGLTHRAHPYPAKFIPHIPRALIDAFSTPGQTVLDPMCGSGTTLVESIASGRPAIGLDINPVSTLVTAAKTTVLNEEDVACLRVFAARVVDQKMPTGGHAPEFHNRSHWFNSDAVDALADLKAAIQQIASPNARQLAFCSFSAIIVGVSRQESETRWRRIDREVSRSDVFNRFSKHLIEDVLANELLAATDPAPASTFNADARQMPVADEVVDLLVTSPPYANSHDYYLYNKLSMFWLDFDVRSTQQAEFGSRNKHSDQKLSIDHYLGTMTAIFAESRRVLREGGIACFVVGDAVIRGEFFDMGELLPRIAESAGLRTMDAYRFHQQKFTRTFMYGFGTKLDKQTHVLVFRKAPTTPAP